MAKAKKTVSECNAPCVGDYKPRLYLDLQDKDVSQLKGLTVGEEVEVVVHGTVRGLEQRERTNEKGETEKTGSIQLEGYRVSVLDDEENPFIDMANDDE